MAESPETKRAKFKFSNILAKKVREAMVSKNLSQREVTDLCGIKGPSLSNILYSHSNIGFYMGLKLCKGLDIDLDEIMREMEHGA